VSASSANPNQPKERLEDLWAGEFGDAYVERNRSAADGSAFWRETLADRSIQSALEVGCNVGLNLRWLAELLGPDHVAGLDVNEKALAEARTALPGADLRRAAAYELPFEDASFDLVFTTGVLIHIDPSDIHQVMAEIVRCSRRYVFCGEYYSEEPEEVPYRGERGALFKRDFGGAYLSQHPELSLIDTGLMPEDVWDRTTWWLFEK
jgi:pseudaminic acid biosynthesis-associated methylase